MGRQTTACVTAARVESLSGGSCLNKALANLCERTAVVDVVSDRCFSLCLSRAIEKSLSLQKSAGL